MTGTLEFAVTPVHMHQRRFDSESLANALRDSHVYIISRRPAVRITYHFAHRNRVFLNFLLRAQADVQPREIQHNLIADYGQVLSCRTFEDGAYFAINNESDSSVLHGDSWALASFLSGAPEAIADKEVLYIGQAYGKDGEQNSWLRTRRHETLQHIYEEHGGSEWDIFVTPLRIEHSWFGSDDHLDDIEEDGPDLLKMIGVFWESLPDYSGSRILNQGLTLLNMA